MVLQFDHLDPSQKLYTVSELVGQNGKQDLLYAEIAKCVVRCANCHSIKTARDGQWYRDIDTGPWKYLLG